jgi:N-ethylmaleimide reductase
MAEYYAQRAGAGLIISEAIAISAQGRGYLNIPGLYAGGHVEGWRAVTAATHAAGGRIVAQLFHTGRIHHPELMPDGSTPVAPSAIAARGKTWTPKGELDFVTPRALLAAEIPDIIDSYVAAAQHAIAAGFDGVEFHAASGYLPMQFLSTGTNTRTDGWGGSLAGRLRFTVEAMQAIAAAIGADRLGIKISPAMGFNDITDENPAETYTALVGALDKLGLAYLHCTPYGGHDHHTPIRRAFRGAYFAGLGMTRQTGEAMLAAGGADAIVYGVPFIANPDLPARFAADAALAEGNRATYYGGDAAGYTDYPPLAG